MTTEEVAKGGTEALTAARNDDRRKLRVLAGALCSSFRAELTALLAALNNLLECPEGKD